MTSGLRRVVVVGASAAGLTAAEALRRGGYDGQLTMVGDEPHLPYDRPPLSKQVLAGSWEPDRTRLRDAAAYQRADIELRLGVAATAVDTAARTVELAGGERLRFDALVVATGAQPRRLPTGHSLAGVHVLRTVDDARGLRAGLLGASRVVVVGAGFLGAEAAATARGLGLDVTMVDVLPVPMVAQFGELVGNLVGELHRDHGVRVRTGTGVAGLHGGEQVAQVELTDGTKLDTDLVLVAIGARPATGWLAGSGLPLRDGLVCDATCRAAPGVYAAGDVAWWHNPRFGTGMRVEHRMNATEQGMAVARNLLGPPAPFDPIPYFWTDQFDTRIQAHGIFPPGSRVSVAHGDLAQRRFVLHYRRDGQITGVLGWNLPRELRADRDLIQSAPATSQPIADRSR